MTAHYQLELYARKSRRPLPASAKRVSDIVKAPLCGREYEKGGVEHRVWEYKAESMLYLAVDRTASIESAGEDRCNESTPSRESLATGSLREKGIA